MTTPLKKSRLFTALTCAQLALFAWPLAPACRAQSPAAAAAPKPEISIIRDQSVMEVFLRYSPDGRELARIPQFGQVQLSDTATFTKVRTFAVGLRMVAYSPDGTKIATAEGTDGARVWDAAIKGTGEAEAGQAAVQVLDTPLKVLQEPGQDRTQRVLWTEFSPDGKRLITAHGNGHVKVWDSSTWAMEEDIALGDREVRAAAFSPDGRTLVFGDGKGMLYQWSFEKKAPVKSALTGGPYEPVMGVTFAPDGKTLVTAHQGEGEGAVRVWNTETWAVRPEEGYMCAAFSKDGKVLALGGTNVKLVEPVSGKAVRTVEFPELSLRDMGPAFAALADADTKIPVQITALAFSPDGGTLAVGSRGPLRLVKLSAK